MLRCAGWERGAPPSAATLAMGEPPPSPAPEAGGAEDGVDLVGYSVTGPLYTPDADDDEYGWCCAVHLTQHYTRIVTVLQ